MKLTSTLTRRNGNILNYTYHDVVSCEELENKGVMHVCGYSFYNGKFLIVRDGERNKWTPPGGGREGSESITDGTAREIQEESNMKVLYQMPIGYQEIIEKDGSVSVQSRSFCVVEPYGDFVADPIGDVVEIKLIEPEDYKQYFDWGEIGDHIMKRALEMYAEYKANM